MCVRATRCSRAGRSRATSSACCRARGAATRATTRAKNGSCVFAEIDGPRGPIQVFCAHLSWRDDHSAIRQAQVARDLRASSGETRPRPFPAVLCGDLNAEPDSDEIRMLTGRAAVPVPACVPRRVGRGGQRRTRVHGVERTIRSSAASLDRERRIDYVMVGMPKLGGVGHVLDVCVFADKPVEKMWASDHFAVVTELRY